MRTRAFNLQEFFSPSSIAIIGASDDFTSIGGKIVRNLIQHGYKGKLFLVNPKYDRIQEYKCYPTILDIPEEVELALIAISHKKIKNIMEQCGEKKVKYAILFGAGFAELGPEGEKLQQEVLDVARKSDIRIIGPNCVGCLNVIDQIPMGFATSFEAQSFISGNIALASQSGAFGYSVFGLAQEEQIGFSYIANTGNQADITTLDFLKEMLNDEKTDVLAAYLESVPDGEQFLRILKCAKEKRKPVIVLKSGRSQLGQKAALSHTASVAGSAQVYEAVAEQYGAISVSDIDDMIDAMKIFSRKKYVLGSKIAVVTTSGAAGIAMADLSEKHQLEMAQLSSKTKAIIEDIIPSFGSSLNPIDITLQALNEKSILSDTIEALVKAEECDVIVVSTTLGGKLGERVCRDIVELDRKTEKPIVVTLTGRKDIIGEGLNILQKAGVPVYQTPSQTIRSISMLVKYSKFIKRKEDRIIETPKIRLGNPKGVWTEEKVKDILQNFHFRIPKGTVIRSETEIESLVNKFTFPLVAKVISPDILHKTDAKAVKLGIKTKEDVVNAYREILRNTQLYSKTAKIEGILIEEMLEKNGVEMFIGVKHDSIFGPIVACGLGGIFIEVLKDVSLRRAPFGKETALEMIRELKGYAILAGVRGREKADIDAFAKALTHISNFAYHQRNLLKELDINPVVVLKEGQGVVALDGIIKWN
ncbi:acetate--CoA ligase family protein [Bacillus alveayuensis]|uniref:acetate--CoA ligase family protein n=1 Tax=Aeribacillus alveayuensis TaxID=279215 RepID=UPI0005CD7C75|nr:acetate--CoA ligase family protein [Bacillus alveayuensis]